MDIESNSSSILAHERSETLNSRKMTKKDRKTIALSMSRIHQKGSVFLLKYQFANLSIYPIECLILHLRCKGSEKKEKNA